MKKQNYLLFLFCWSGCFLHSDNSEENFQRIRQLNERMETLYEEGNANKLAAFYTEDAIVFGPNDELRGSNAIQSYWGRIASPVSLSLEILDLNTELDSLGFIKKNIETKKEIPSDFIDQLNPDANHVFQLTKTTLSYEREDVTLFRSETISLINWEEQTEGRYRISAVWLMQ